MKYSEYIGFLSNTTENQVKALHFHIFFATSVVLLGMIAIAISQLLSGKLIPSDYKWLTTIGGTFITTLSSFPAKELFNKKDKINALEFLISEFKRLEKTDFDLNSSEGKLLMDQFWKTVNSIIGK